VPDLGKSKPDFSMSKTSYNLKLTAKNLLNEIAVLFYFIILKINTCF